MEIKLEDLYAIIGELLVQTRYQARDNRVLLDTNKELAEGLEKVLKSLEPEPEEAANESD